MGFNKLIFLLIISLQMLGCSNTVDGTLFNAYNEKNCLDTEGAVCFSESRDKLAIDTSERTIYLKPNQVVFNIGGECNEGGFPTNRIDWHFMVESSKEVVANSLGVINPGAICGDPNALTSNLDAPSDGLGNAPSTCINGRYNLKITIPSAIANSHDLFLCISGGRDGKYQMGGSSLNINVEKGI